MGMDASLDPQQQAAVLAPRGPVCVLAGAGTGKTRTITRRIAHLVGDGHVRAGQVLAVTFTSRAAGEMRTRLRSLGISGQGNAVQALTFHAAAMRQLRYFWPQAIGENQWELLDNKFPVVSRAARAAGAPTTTESLRDLISEIEWAKGSLIGPSEYPAAVYKSRRESPLPAEQVALVYERYEQAKVSPAGDQLLDFDDLLLMTRAILDDHPVIAEEFRDRYRCFVVDEYQDVTPAQQALLNAWVGPRDDLTVVGDANQTIYSFTGATPGYLLDFSRRFPDATVVRLERDYRSTPQVVQLANSVIGAARGRIAGTRLQLIGQRDPGPEPDFSEHPDEAAEAKSVARAIKRLMKSGVPGSEIAILYRVNAQSEVHEQALTAAGIPYQVRGGEAFFSRSEVRQAMRAVNQAAQRDDLPPEAETLTLLRAILVPLGLTEEAPAGAQARERWESLRALVTMTEDMLTDVPELTLADLTRELAARAEARHPPTVQGVTLSSLHAAKGLEWDCVFIVGAHEGTLPISYAQTPAQVEEERRLFYVGVTRAKQQLFISWFTSRSPGGRGTRGPTRFLDPIGVRTARTEWTPSASVGYERPSGESRSGRPIPKCRVCGRGLLDPGARKLGRCEDCPSTIDQKLYDALVEWRTEQAETEKMPAFVILTDATLTAIAETRPGDAQALRQIPGIGHTKLSKYGEKILNLCTR